MANGNPFYISPTGGTGINIGQSLAGLGQALGQMRQIDEAKQAQQAQQNRQRQIGTALSNLYKSGDNEAIANYFIKNPDVRASTKQSVMNAVNARDKAHNNQIGNDLFQVMEMPSSEQKKQFLAQRIKQLHESGQDSSMYARELGYLIHDPDSSQRDMETFAATSFPERYKSYHQAKYGDNPLEQGTGTMAGYSFNPNTGVYTIDPSIKSDVDYQKQVKQAKAEKTLDLQSLNNNRLRAENLYSDFNKSQKNFYTMQQAHENIDSALKVGKTDPTGTSDIALLYQYNHLLDPTSVVREGEFAKAQNSAGMVNGVFNLLQQVKSGKLLTPEQRKSIKAIADDHMKRMQGRYNQEKKWTISRAKNWGLNPGMVFPKGVDEAGVAGQQAEYPEGSPESTQTSVVPSNSVTGVQPDQTQTPSGQQGQTSQYSSLWGG